MTPQEAQKLFNEEFQARLHAAEFPFLDLPQNFNLYVHAAVQHESVDSISRLGFSWQAYKIMLMKRASFTLFEIGQLVSIIQTKTPAQLQPLLGKVNYYDAQAEIMSVAKRWNELVHPIREAVDKKIQIMAGGNGSLAAIQTRQRNNNGSKFIR